MTARKLALVAPASERAPQSGVRRIVRKAADQAPAAKRRTNLSLLTERDRRMIHREAMNAFNMYCEGGKAWGYDQAIIVFAMSGWDAWATARRIVTTGSEEELRQPFEEYSAELLQMHRELDDLDPWAMAAGGRSFVMLVIRRCDAVHVLPASAAVGPRDSMVVLSERGHLSRRIDGAIYPVPAGSGKAWRCTLSDAVPIPFIRNGARAERPPVTSIEQAIEQVESFTIAEMP